MQVIHSSNYDRLNFCCKLRSSFSSVHALEFENKGALFLEKDQYKLKKEQHKRQEKNRPKLEKNVQKSFRFFKNDTHLGVTITPKKGPK